MQKKNGYILKTANKKGLCCRFTVESNISMAILKRIKKLGFISMSSEKEIALKQVKALDVKTPSIKTTVKSLSGGNQQKCMWALA